MKEYVTPIQLDQDCLDPEVKRQKIMEKAEIEEICNDIFDNETKEEKITAAKCINCEQPLVPVDTHYFDTYQCTGCGCKFAPSGVYQNRVLWVCVFDPNQDN